MNQHIDYITYTATSTDITTGYVTIIQAEYYVPFLDYFLIYTVLMFTNAICGLMYFVFKKR